MVRKDPNNLLSFYRQVAELNRDEIGEGQVMVFYAKSDTARVMSLDDFRDTWWPLLDRRSYPPSCWQHRWLGVIHDGLAGQGAACLVRLES